jgi:ABC-type transport system involved in multi-copper enzyme maturation permease subunit
MRWGLGPVFACEWLTTSRRWQLYALRALAVALLGGALAVAWFSTVDSNDLPIRKLAAVGTSFFYALVGTQLTLVLLAAPAYTAGSVCVDKTRGTLAHLLVTDLSNAELILGKLASRSLPVAGLVLAGVPVLFSASLLGGIDPEAALGATSVTLAVALVGCTLALTLSVWGTKPQEVLLVSYLAAVLVLLAQPTVWVVSSFWSAPARPSWLLMLNPYVVAFLPYLYPGLQALEPQAEFVATALAISAILALLAIARVRAVALRHASRPAARVRRWWMRCLPRRPRWLPAPTLDGNPVLWREWHRRRSSRWVRWVWLVYCVLASVFSAAAILEALSLRFPDLAAITNAVQVPVGLLLLSAASVTALAEERMRGSLEVLLATPLSSRTILWGKWVGAFRPVLWLAVLPCLIGAVLAATHGRWLGAVALSASVLAYGVAVTSIGLLLATWIARLGRAVAASAMAIVVLTMGPVLVLPLADRLGHPFRDVVAHGSPFFGMGQTTAMMRYWVRRDDEYDLHMMTALGWVIAYVAAGAIVFELTVNTFDGRLGRVPEQPRRRPTLPSLTSDAAPAAPALPSAVDG